MKDRGYTGWAGSGPAPLPKEEAKPAEEAAVVVEEVKEEESKEITEENIDERLDDLFSPAED